MGIFFSTSNEGTSHSPRDDRDTAMPEGMDHWTRLRALRRAVDERAPVDRVRFLLDTTPEQVVRQYAVRMLKDAMKNGSSVDVVRLLLERTPQESLDIKLYELVEAGLDNDANADVLRLLVEQNPAVAFYELGLPESYLLYLACQYQAPHEFIEYLVELNPKALGLSEYHTGEIPLHQACYLPLDTFGLMVDPCPDSIYRTTREGQIPLHFACMCGASLEVVQFLVTRYPTSVHRADNDDFLPLHGAACCGEDTARAVYDYLVNLSPDDVSARTAHGRLPLHFACESPSWDVARALIEAYQDGVHVVDSRGRAPFSYASEWDVPLDLAERLLEINPDCIRTLDVHGWLPLHYACNKATVSDDVLNLMLRMYPEAAKVVSGDGWLPLHVACVDSSDEEGVRLSFIELLVQANPLALVTKQQKHGTPLMIAYSNRHADNAMKTYLLREQERVVQSHVDAIKSTAGGMVGFDDLVANKIWTFIDDLWRPSGRKDKRLSRS